MAILLYKLMLYQDVSNIREPKVDSKSKKVLNLKYVMNVECYNPGFELLKMYGKLEEPEKINLNEMYKECLQGVVISPVRHEKDWWNYSKKLKEKMVKEVESKFIEPLFYFDGKKEEPNNILIITNDYRDILLKEYIQFEVVKEVDDAYIQVDIDKPPLEDLKLKLYEKFSNFLRNKSLNNITQKALKDLVTSALLINK